MASRPLPQCVHRLVVEAAVADDHSQSSRWGEAGTDVAASDGGVEPLIETQTRAEVVDQRQGIEHLGMKVEASAPGVAVASGHSYLA